MVSRALFLIVTVSAGLLAQPADARPRERDSASRQERQRERHDDRSERREQPPDSLRDDRGHDRGHSADRPSAAAMRALERNGGGRVLAVEPSGTGYRVKVLKNGEVRTHHVED